MLSVEPSADRQMPGPPVAAPATRTRWIFSGGPDLLIALCWVPLWLAGHRLVAGHGAHDDALLRSAVAGVFLLSFLHQPVTLALVYGDANQFRQRRRLFLWTPPLTVAVIIVAVALHLWIVIPIAAIWNTVHTLQQRYGLARIYSRKAGYGSARLDRWVLYAWMAAALLAVAANPGTLGLVQRVALDNVNGGGVHLLTDARPWAVVMLVPAAVTALWLTGALVRQELTQRARAGAAAGDGVAGGAAMGGGPGGPANPANPAKWLYQASSLLLIASIAVDPAAGFIAYVGAHAIEYFVVAYKTTQSRYEESAGSSLLGRLAHRTPGRLAGFGAVVAVAVVAHARLEGSVFNVVLYTVGVLHFLYDGVIWKLRKPAVAADFAIPAATR